MPNHPSENSHVIKLAHTDLTLQSHLSSPGGKPATGSVWLPETDPASTASKRLAPGPIITDHHSALS